MSTVCLAIMAKNEAHVIARALASARPLVDAWVVVDTGSTDATREIAREAMRGVPGDVVEKPWRGNAGSRTDSFEAARSRADYVLLLDADDVLEFPSGARFPELTEPGYLLMLNDGPLMYPRVMLVGSAWPWRFEGVIHEYGVCDGLEAPPALLDGIVYRRIGGGARDSDPRKYRRDAELLESALKGDPGNARNVFYLARSYEDANELPRALANYERRALMGGWDEEVFYSKYGAARVREKMKLPLAGVVAAYEAAARFRPVRAEPLCDIARLFRAAGDWTAAREHARAAMALSRPNDVLFVDREVYEWRAIEEFAGASAHLGDFDAAIAANQRLLDENRVTPEERTRIARNIALCIEAAASARGD